MRIFVHGASRGVGLALATRALARGHTVTAFARHASAIPLDVQRVDGDGLLAEPLTGALAGHDAVACCVGGAGLSDRSTRTQLTARLLSGMRAHGISRLVLLSSLGAGDSYPRCNLPTKAIVRTLLRHVIADHSAQEALLREAPAHPPLDWTVVRPGGLADGRTGHRVVDDPEARLGGGARVGRDDVAEVMLDALEGERWVRRAVAVLGP